MYGLNNRTKQSARVNRISFQTQKGDSLTFGTGVFMSSNFLRPQNNQSNFFKDPK